MSGRAFINSIKEGFRGIIRHPLVTIASITTIMLMLIIMGAFYLFCINSIFIALATFLMVRKDINAWICYLICDAIYIPLGIISVAHGGSYKWFFISACFLATATYGTINFIKAYRLSKQSKEQ